MFCYTMAECELIYHGNVDVATVNAATVPSTIRHETTTTKSMVSYYHRLLLLVTVYYIAIFETR
jgi:hypothetical protein